MPMFDFQCDACGWTGEKYLPTYATVVTCPHCDGPLRKLPSAASHLTQKPLNRTIRTEHAEIHGDAPFDRGVPFVREV
jgi:putative FmdB family regulatory protein